MRTQTEQFEEKQRELSGLRVKLENKINSDLFKIHKKIDGSHLENEAGKPELFSQDYSKVDKTEFTEALGKKSNKNDIEMILRLIKNMHNHSSSIS